MRLTHVQEKLIDALDLSEVDARRDIASRLKLKPSTVQHNIKALLDRGVLVRRVRIDFFRLGLLDIGIFFSVAQGSQRGRNLLERWLIDDQRTAWVGRLSGEYQYAAVLLVRSLHDVAAFLEDLKSFQGVQVGERVLAPRMSYTQYSRAYFGKGTPRRAVEFLRSPEIYTLDPIDHRILSNLGNQPFDSLRRVARDLHLPPSTIDYRVNTLRAAGVILGIYYELNPWLLGIQSFRFLVRTRSLADQTLKRFHRFCSGHPHVVFFTNAFGSWDYEISAEVNTASQAFEFVGELSELLASDLISIRAVQEIADLKWTFYPLPDVLAPSRAVSR